jgi:hypothetical protein
MRDLGSILVSNNPELARPVSRETLAAKALARRAALVITAAGLDRYNPAHRQLARNFVQLSDREKGK